MSNFGKPDPTGRSSGKRTGRAGRAHRPPKGESWTWVTRGLLNSPSWRALSTNTVRLIHFLMIEHMNHAGTENGQLMATYEQLEAYGLSRNRIAAAVKEAMFLGLVRCVRGGRWAGTNKPSTYRLTFLADRDGNPPTNEWKGRTEAQIREWKAERKRDHQARQNQKATRKTVSTTAPISASTKRGNGIDRDAKPPGSADLPNQPVLTKG